MCHELSGDFMPLCVLTFDVAYEARSLFGPLERTVKDLKRLNYDKWMIPFGTASGDR